MTTAYHPWGRVDADGTVYVRTADGASRVIGSWQAGSPEEAIAFFARKYEALGTEVVLLEQRIAATDMAPAQAPRPASSGCSSTSRTPNALGDLDGLRAPPGAADRGRRPPPRGGQGGPGAGARGGQEVKERIVAEAEQIAAEATHWKSSGERMRELLVVEGGAARRAGRRGGAVEAAVAAAQRLHRAAQGLLRQPGGRTRGRQGAQGRSCAPTPRRCPRSTDWGRDRQRVPRADAAVEGGRAGRTGDSEAELWKRFPGGPGQVLTARGRGVLGRGRRALAPRRRWLSGSSPDRPGAVTVTDIRAAMSALRGIQEKLGADRAVPRDSREHLESGLRRVEDALRKAEETQWRRSTPEALAEAEGTDGPAALDASPSSSGSWPRRATRATPRRERTAEEALTARRAWLAEAEHTLAELRGYEVAAPRDAPASWDAPRR